MKIAGSPGDNEKDAGVATLVPCTWREMEVDMGGICGIG